MINNIMTITIVKTLRERLIYARELRGLSQAELAKRCKCSQGTIGNVESGERETLRNLVLVARVLRISADWLFDGRGPKPEKSDTLEQQAGGVLTYKTHAEFHYELIEAAAPSNLLDITPQKDKYTQEVLRIMSGLDESQKMAALARLREFVTYLAPPENGQTLLVAG